VKLDGSVLVVVHMLAIRANHLDFDPRFFTALAYRRLLWSFPKLDLAARKLATASQWDISRPLTDQEPATPLDNSHRNLRRFFHVFPAGI
jgi:hypothetical protein